jgi:hypothetical protein
MKHLNSTLAWSGIAMTTCLSACLGDIIAVNLFSRYYPGFDARLQPISALGAQGSPVARLVSGWWIFAGFIFLIFAIAYKRSEELQTRPHVFSAWLFGIYAVGEEIGSGIFPGNRILGQLTTIGIVHNVIGGIGTLALIISPFVLLKKYLQTNHRLMRRYLIFVCISGVLTFIVFILSHFRQPGLEWLYLHHGLLQRIFIFDYYLYMMVIAVRLYYDKRTAQLYSWFIPLQQP